MELVVIQPRPKSTEPKVRVVAMDTLTGKSKSLTLRDTSPEQVVTLLRAIARKPATADGDGDRAAANAAA